jgi:hypothetical protein
MSPAEYAAWVRNYASSIGLDPNLAESIWRQESGGSLDTTLKGAALSRGRGNAIGPWQVVPYYHPDFPVEGDPMAQGRYAMDYLKKVGPAGYYGRGQAMPGHPTTEQYVQQVQDRAARLGGVDVRMAALGPDPGIMSTDTQPEIPTGNPEGGRMDQPRSLPGMADIYSAQQELEALRRAHYARGEAAAPFGLADALAIAAGMAMGGGSALSAVGDWATARRSYDEEEYKRKARAAADFATSARAEAALADMEDRLARKRWAASLPEDERALAEAGYGDEVAKRRLTPPAPPKAPEIKEIQVGGETKTMQWDPVTGRWTELASAPRWQPAAPPQPPSGYAVTPTGLAPIPGGPADPKPQAGYTWAEPGNPGAGVVPVTGSKEAEEVRGEIQAMEDAIAKVDRLTTLTDNWKNSTLLVGDSKAYGEAGTIVAALQSALFKAWGLGVPQAGDYEMVAKAMPDPTQWSSLMDSDDTMAARAKALKREFENRIAFLRKEGKVPLPSAEETARKRAQLMGGQ